VVIFLTSLDLEQNPHFWMDTNYRFYFIIQYHLQI